MAHKAGFGVLTVACATVLVVASAGASSAVPVDAQTASPCGGSSGLNIAIVNKTGKPASQVNWFVQQKRKYKVHGAWAVAPNPELVAGPFKLSERKSIKCEAMNAGQVVVTLGTKGSVTPPARPASDPAHQPTYAQPSPDTEQKRFQTVELTVPGIVNLTAVDMFGIPIDIATSAGRSRVWKCYTDVVKSSLQKSLRAAGGNYPRTLRVDSSKQFLRLVSPNVVSGLHPSGYPRFDAYLNSVKGKTLTVKRTKGVDFSPYGYSYSGKVALNGSIVLRPTSSGASYKSITIPSGSLTSNNGVPAKTGIYGNNSPYYIGTSHTQHFVGENDLYAAAYRDLVAGFAYGFWKKSGPNNSAAFNASKAPGPFKGAQPTNANFYNTWAAALWPLTQAYGFAFEDTYNPGNRNPAIPVTASGALTLTLQPDVTPRGRNCG